MDSIQKRLLYELEKDYLRLKTFQFFSGFWLKNSNNIKKVLLSIENLTVY